MGLTMICTKVGGYHLTALRELWARGEMTIRWRFNHQMIMGSNPEGLLRRVGNLTGVGDDTFKIASIHIGATDGDSDSWTWEPRAHADPRTGELFGLGPVSSGDWANHRGEYTYTVLAAKYGWSILGTHSLGNRGNDAALDAIEQGLRNPIIKAYGQRFGLDHQIGLAVETPDGKQMERMKKLNVIPSMNPVYYIGGEPGAYGLGAPTQIEQHFLEFGETKVMKMLPVKTAIKMGLKPVLESDRGNEYARPLWGMEKLITRKDDKYHRVWGPAERVTRQEALWMHTNWAAYYTGDEKILGTIEPGKLADLVVIGGDYMTIPEDNISKMPILMTIVGGKVVYELPGKLD